MQIKYDVYFFFFFNDTATTEIYTLSLHDALPILVILPVPLVAAVEMLAILLSKLVKLSVTLKN